MLWVWELDYKESWTPKNWCFWTVVLEKTLESPLDYKEIHPVHPKGNQSWIFIGRTDVEAETPILWPPLMQRTDSFEKTLMLGKIEGGRRRGRQRMTWLDVIINSMDMSFSKLQELVGQGGPMCCSPWGCKESNTTTTELHWTELRNIITYFKEWVLSGRNWFFFWTLLNKYHFTRQEELISLDRVTPQSAKGCGNFECYKYCHPQHAQWYLIENESGKLVWYNIVQEIE